ncbi:MAG: cytochrome C, partial [Methanosarcinaceae archaeon]|nr:cytochrome C [Methanosarcinaceae archaeon]
MVLIAFSGMASAAMDHSFIEGPFETGPQVTVKCITCHPDAANEMLDSAHWNWAGPTPDVVGHETETTIGKTNVINNYCIAVPSNEPRCTSCHVGYGWKDSTFDFTDKTNIDCLVCHDGTGTYKKIPTGAGAV